MTQPATGASLDYSPAARFPGRFIPRQLSKQTCLRLMFVFVIFGAGLRTRQFAFDSGLWHDEALVMLNVMNRTPAQLLDPLDYSQAAPPAYLWIERIIWQRSGVSERWLRLSAYLASLAGLVVFACVAWRALHHEVAPSALAWFALCTQLTWHAGEVKQYAWDVLVAVMLLWIALGRDADESDQPRAGARLLLAGLVAAIGVWFSYTMIFVFGGVALALLPRIWRERRRPMSLIAYLAGGALAVGSFAILWWISLRRQNDPYLMRYWSDAMADWSRPLRVPVWLTSQTWELFNHTYRPLPGLLVALSLGGVIGLVFTKRWRLLGLCVLPIALTILAACARRYPYTGSRVTLYLLPGLYLLGAAGLDLARRKLPEPWRALWWLFGAPLLIAGLVTSLIDFVHPPSRSDIRAAVAYVQAHRQPGDAIYLVGEGTEKNRPDTTSGLCLEALCYWPDPPPTLHRTLPALAEIPDGRFWILFPFLPRHGTSYLTVLLNDLDTIAERKDSLVDKRGGAAYLYVRPKN